MDAPKKANGLGVAHIGLREALQACLSRIDGTPTTEVAQGAGSITLHDRRVVDVGVFVRVREGGAA